jgi:hypothetical protein
VLRHPDPPARSQRYRMPSSGRIDLARRCMLAPEGFEAILPLNPIRPGINSARV